MSTIRLTPTVQSIIETEVLELASDPDGYGLDAEEAEGYRLLAAAVNQQVTAIVVPSDPADRDRICDLLTDLSNSADDRAEDGPSIDRRFDRRAASSLATLCAKLRS